MKTFAVLSALCAVLFVLLLWLLPLMFKDQLTTRAVLVMGCVVWLSGLISVLPVAMMGHFGVMQAMKAYLGGAVARVMIILAAVVVGVAVMKLPKMPLVVTLMTMYLPLLFTETALVVRYIKKNDLPASSNLPGTEALA